jgi:hypothetical protein
VLSGSTAVWRAADSANLSTPALKSGGLILIDLDCDYIFDADGQAVSGSASVLAGGKPPVRPGGIFRSWIQVAAG